MNTRWINICRMNIRRMDPHCPQEKAMASKPKKQPEKQDDSFISEVKHRLKTQPYLFIGTVLVLVLVIISFVFVPAIVPSARMRGGGELIFGYYNGVPIKYSRDNYFYNIQQNIARSQQLSQDDPNFIFRYAQIWRQSFDETVVHFGILDEMKTAGYIAPENVVDQEVAKLPYFQENGRFSAARYRAMDNNTRMNIWRQVKDDVIKNIYISDMATLKTASNETSFISSMGSPRRSFDLALFPFSSYPDSEIASFVEANPALFRVIHLSRITVNSGEREARQVLESITNGVSTFEEAARASSQDWYADRGGDMGILMAFELVYEVSDEQARESLIRLPRDSFSDIIKVDSGWAFFRAEEAAQDANINDTAQKEKIRDYIMNNLRGRAEDWLIAEAEKFIAEANEKGFNEAIGSGNIEKRSFGPLPLNYGNSTLFASISSAGVPELTNAGTNQFFWRAAFSTPINSLSRPVVIGDNVAVLLPLEESEADESENEMIEMYYPYWMGSGTEQMYKVHFLTSDKLDDRFQDEFWKIWGSD